MRGLTQYLFASTAILITADASLAERFVAPAPQLLIEPPVIEEAAAASEIEQGANVAVEEAARQFIAPSPLFEEPVTPVEVVTKTAEAPVLQKIATSENVPFAVKNAETVLDAPALVSAEAPVQNGVIAPAPSVVEPVQAAVQEAEKNVPPPVKDAAVEAPVPVIDAAENIAKEPAAKLVNKPEPLTEGGNKQAWKDIKVAPPKVTAETVAGGEFSLLAALTEAYLNNPRLIAERERQKVTDEQVAQAISGFRPTANLSLDIGRQQTSFNGASKITGDADQTNLRIEQPLFRGGGTVAGYQSAKQQVTAGRYTLSAVEQTVMFDTIQAYMDVVQAQSILTIARNNRSVLGEQLKAAQERFDVGEVTRTDVAQATARVSDASAQVINAEGELISAVAGLENFIGKKPDGAVSSPGQLPRSPSNLSEALSSAHGANPQLLQTIHSEKAAKYEVRRNVASILPSVSLVGTVSRQEGAGVLGTTQFNQNSLRVNFNIPLYQSGSEYSRVRAAKAQRSQRKFEMLNARLAVDAIVTQAWESLETSIATIGAREDQIKAAEVALDGVKQEQLYGARTVLDVLDAEQELFVAKSNLVRADRDRVVAVFGLLQSMGQLTPANLGLAVDTYNPNKNLDRIKWLPIGF